MKTYTSFQELFAEIKADFEKLDYEQPLRNFIPELEKGEEQVFSGEHTPGGESWKPLAPSTIARKGHDTILFETGRLRESLISTTGDSIREVTDRGIGFGTEVPYSIFHQEGTSKIPQREHVGLSETTLDLLCDKMANATVEGLKE